MRYGRRYKTQNPPRKGGEAFKNFPGSMLAKRPGSPASLTTKEMTSEVKAGVRATRAERAYRCGTAPDFSPRLQSHRTFPIVRRASGRQAHLYLA
jgi:hypothetical protein